MDNKYQAPNSTLERDEVNNSGSGQDEFPEGVKGWSWGAFLLNWIWSINNKTWIGLFAIIPYIGLIMAIILGVKGREWAWKNKRWESVDHFNTVQKRWSFWGILLTILLTTIGIVAAIAIPAYQDYTAKSQPQTVDSELDKFVENYPGTGRDNTTPSPPEGFEWEKAPIDNQVEPEIVQGGDPNVQDWTKRITAWYAANKDFLSDEKHRAAVVRWVEKYGADPSINNAELISIIEKNALNEFGYTKTPPKLPSKGDIAPNWINSKEQKCRDQFYSAVNSADQDMPLGEYAEFEEKARQRQRVCNNR